MKTKLPAFDGKFYPKDSIELESKIKYMFKEAPKVYNYKSRALIVPHAGYIYSGKVCANTYQYFSENVDNVFIFAPAHYVDFKGIALSTSDSFSTPLGTITVNQELNQKLSEHPEVKSFDAAFEKEHSLEVQLPFIQTLLPKAKIVPIVYNNCSAGSLEEIIRRFWDNEELGKNGFIISSDLSHFYPKSEAEKIDEYTANMIETQDIKNFHPAQACGSTGIIALTNFAKEKGFDLIRVQLTNSAETTKDDASVVGYGGWFMICEKKITFLKKNFSELIIDIAKKSIKSGLETGNIQEINASKYPPVFKEKGAAFVTLELNGELRGCIGSVVAHRALLEDIIYHSYNAAFQDDRFMPLTADEFKNLKISVSLLSEPQELKFNSELELLEKIEPFKDGLIIQDNNKSAVYLPSVWEQLPDKELFLNSLKRKAGMKENHFSKTFKAYRFETEYIKG